MAKECRRYRRWDMPHGELTETFLYVGRLHRMALERLLNRTGVHRSQHQLLMHISDNPNASQKEIARLYQVSAATVAVSLKKLEHGGYIRREVDADDNRFNQICITEKGQAVIDSSIRYFEKMERAMFSGFTQEECDTLKSYMDRIEKNLMTTMNETESEETT